MNETGRTILVADDDAKVRNLVATILRSHGFVVMEAQNGFEAVQLYGYHHGEIALVVTDLDMPVMDGMETVERIRAIDPAAAVLIVSGRPAGEVTGCCRLTKPFLPNQLLEAVELALKGGG